MTIDGEGIREGVPLQLLATVFRGVQDTIYHMAMAESGHDVRPRARVPDDIRTQYQLIRAAEHNSAYTIEAAFASPAQASLSFEPNRRTAVLEKYTSLLGALSESGDHTLSVLFPDTMWRRRILRSLEVYCPKKGDQWHLTVSHEPKGTAATLSAVTRERISRLLAEPGFEETTVSGELVRIHLDEHKLGIYYQPTSRVLDCYYDPELEDLIVENLKGIVHVAGRVQLRVQLDANGFPDKIVDVSDIRALDLRPLMLKSIETAEGRLVLRRAESVRPSFEDGEVVFELPDLHIVASGATREDAVEKLFSDLIWLWKEYVLAPHEELSQDARELAERLRGMIEEASVGNG
jgi:hypothetical protein